MYEPTKANRIIFNGYDLSWYIYIQADLLLLLPRLLLLLLLQLIIIIESGEWLRLQRRRIKTRFSFITRRGRAALISVGGIVSRRGWAVPPRCGERKPTWRALFRGAGLSFIGVGGVGRPVTDNQRCLSFHAQWPGRHGARRRYPSSSSNYPHRHTAGVSESHLITGILHVTKKERKKNWSWDAIYSNRSTEARTRSDLLAVMDFPKAQTVSVRGWLGTIPLAVLTVTKQLAALTKAARNAPPYRWSSRFSYWSGDAPRAL